MVVWLFSYGLHQVTIAAVVVSPFYQKQLKAKQHPTRKTKKVNKKITVKDKEFYKHIPVLNTFLTR